jgi:DNA polymerase III subunit gamma/tau
MDEYIVSARKYRPMTFDSVVGQHALTTTLKNAVKSGKLAHAYLFCGPRGVGKTTCARIFAKAINCEHPTADGEACNECESCRAFNEQRSFNIFELDAASNNSVENIKTLMEQTRIPPQVGKYKVFIIDEVHMLSTAAFNAFLKTLEEPPAHVIFILATTEKNKILPTILSRCQIYDFERMTLGNTVNHLKYVADKEGIQYEAEALNVIAEKADGGMRDALSIFDQAVSFCQGNVTYKKVIEDLNVLDTENYFKMIDLSLENKPAEMMVLLNNVINKGFDGGNLIGGLASHVRNVLMAKDDVTLPLLEVSDMQRQRYQEQSKKCPTPFLYKALEYLNNCDINYRQSRNKRLLVEITLIQVAQITQPGDDSVGSGRRPTKILKPLFKQLVVNVKPTVARTTTVNPVQAAQSSIAQSVAQQQHVNTLHPSNAPQISKGAKPLKLSNIGVSLRPISPNTNTVPAPQAKSTNYESQPSNIENKDKTFNQEQLNYCWMDLCKHMPQNEVAMAERMKNMNPKIIQGSVIEIVIDNDYVMKDMEKNRNQIIRTLSQSLQNGNLEIKFRLAKPDEIHKAFTRAEQFMEMGKKNSALLKLKDILGLELA